MTDLTEQLRVLGDARLEDAPLIPALPAGAKMLHIGLPKTGTSAIQYAASTQREAMREAGVCYPGSGLNHFRAALSLMRLPYRDQAVPAEVWQQVRDEMRAEHWRAAWLSQELIADADEPIIERFASELGSPPHVVITVRSLESWLPSVWQQYVKSGLTSTFDDWLRTVLTDSPMQLPLAPFLYQLPSTVARRWVPLSSSVTIVVLDKRRPGLMFSAFEGLLGLPSGTLQVSATGGHRTNRGLSTDETDYLRLLNVDFDRNTAPPGAYFDLVRMGVVAGLQELRSPGQEETTPRLPPWARNRVQELALSEIRAIETLDVRVVGNLASIAETSTSSKRRLAPARAAHDIGVQALVAAFSKAQGSGVAFEVATAAPIFALALDREAEIARTIAALPTRRLVRILFGRMLRRLGARTVRAKN